MSKIVKKVSAEEQDEQKNNSVYDFLYYDKQRVGSFLAQFSDAGHLQQIRESESASKGAKRGFKVGAGATVMGTGGNLSFDRSPGEYGSEATERTYDPLWTNALEFLKSLAERKLINRNVTGARIGQFVLASGALSITDMPLLRKIWEVPAMKAAMVAQFQAVLAAQLAQIAGQPQPPPQPQPNPAPAPPQAQPQMPLQMQAAMAPAIMEILTIVPQFLQATIDGQGYSVWCGLADDWLIGTSADFALKHGYEIAGEWALLGIVDALPGALPTAINIPPVAFGVPQNQGPNARNLSVAARTSFGRSAEAYGVTPLLIFRKVTG